jgi:uncharacterized protein
LVRLCLNQVGEIIKNIKELVFILLPILLWPISFILLRSIFIYALLGSVFILAGMSLLFYKKSIPWKKLKDNKIIILAGIVGAILLYLIFFFGNFATSILGINGLVGNVYQMIYGSVPKLPLVILLFFIAIFEEIYWRGALQTYIKNNSKMFHKHSWLLATIYYGLVHIASLNPILVLAALLVGLVTSLIADRYGIVSSIITHIVWIELIVVFLPVMIK